MSSQLQLSAAALGPSVEDATEQRCWILGLPNELLCLVLAAAASAEPPKRLDENMPLTRDINKRRCEYLGFLRLSEVCSRFRALLLSMPSVWASVIFELPVEPSKLALLRSQSYPLSVHIYEVEDWSQLTDRDEDFDAIFEHFVAVASEQAGRIRSLTTSNRAALYKTPSFANELLILEELKFDYFDDAQSTRGLRYSCVNAPRLQRAYFTLFDPGSMFAIGNRETGLKFNFPSLRSLVIHLEYDDAHVPSDVAWVVDLLQASPLLEVIRVPFGLPIEGNGSWDMLFKDRNIQLKHLRTFELQGDSALDITSLYNHICPTRPQRCILNLSPPQIDYDKAVHDVAQFATSFAHLLQHPSHNGLYLTRVFNEYSCPLLVGVFPAANNSQFSAGMSEMISLNIPSAYRGKDIISPQVSDALAAALKHNRIQQLVLRVSSRRSWPYDLDAILKTCSHVTQLEIQTWGADGTTEFAVPMRPDLLPCLDSVIIGPITWNYEGDKFFDCWGNMVLWLTYRALNGLRIRCLRIHGPSFTRGMDDAMRQRDQTMCSLAAKLVDEFFDERVGRA